MKKKLKIKSYLKKKSNNISQKKIKLNDDLIEISFQRDKRE